ncbi:MAG: site-specific integrase, partial [Alteromonadaceae bacterium]|nr:site-specific integrase [Alteromonadaceae bacterium]
MNNTVVKVRAKVVEDDTGIFSHVPVLISESGNIIDPLLSYTLKLKRDGLSNSTIDIAIRATLLLLKYMAANESGFDNPKLLFELFTSRLYTGTFDDNGYDPSGLCWLPIGSRTAKQYIGA